MMEPLPDGFQRFIRQRGAEIDHELIVARTVGIVLDLMEELSSPRPDSRCRADLWHLIRVYLGEARLQAMHGYQQEVGHRGMRECRRCRRWVPDDDLRHGYCEACDRG